MNHVGDASDQGLFSSGNMVYTLLQTLVLLVR
jgi:hypothetical protein